MRCAGGAHRGGRQEGGWVWVSLFVGGWGGGAEERGQGQARQARGCVRACACENALRRGTYREAGRGWVWPCDHTASCDNTVSDDNTVLFHWITLLHMVILFHWHNTATCDDTVADESTDSVLFPAHQEEGLLEGVRGSARGAPGVGRGGRQWGGTELAQLQGRRAPEEHQKQGEQYCTVLYSTVQYCTGHCGGAELAQLQGRGSTRSRGSRSRNSTEQFSTNWFEAGYHIRGKKKT